MSLFPHHPLLTTFGATSPSGGEVKRVVGVLTSPPEGEVAALRGGWGGV